jgi:hypothetical protein
MALPLLNARRLLSPVTGYLAGVHRAGRTLFPADSPATEYDGAAQHLVLLLQQAIAALELAQLCGLISRGAGLGALLDVGGLDPADQARLADTEVGSDLLERLARLTVPRSVTTSSPNSLGNGLGTATSFQ